LEIPIGNPTVCLRLAAIDQIIDNLRTKKASDQVTAYRVERLVTSRLFFHSPLMDVSADPQITSKVYLPTPLIQNNPPE
jgi:hypothetical protein